MDQLHLYRWALLRIARGDSTDPELDAHGYGTFGGGDYDPQAIAEAALRGDEDTVMAVEPSGLTREMIEFSP